MSYLLHMSLHMFAVRFHPHNAVTGISSLSPYVLGSAMAWHWRPPTLQMLNPCGSLQAEKKAFIFFGLRSTACFFQCWHGGKNSHYSQKNDIALSRVWIQYSVGRGEIYYALQFTFFWCGPGKNTTCPNKTLQAHIESPLFIFFLWILYFFFI